MRRCCYFIAWKNKNEEIFFKEEGENFCLSALFWLGDKKNFLF